MSRRITTLAGMTGSVLRILLNSVSPGFAGVYAARRYSSTATLEKSLVEFTTVSQMAEKDLIETSKGLEKKLFRHSKGYRLDLSRHEVMQVSTEDIELTSEDKVGQIIVFAGGDLQVRYGKIGIAPSESKLPSDLLTQSLTVPKGVIGVLDVLKHVPFSIHSQESATPSFALAACQLSRVLNHQERLKQFSLNAVVELNEDLSKRTAIRMQDRIFSDRSYEKFYEEVTSRVYPPDEFRKSSATLMNFERKKFGVDNTTEMHYHPGERVILIFATDKEAGVTLNFCGIAEDPDQRKDCEVRLQFKQNAISTLVFPPYTHHKFHGEFVCISFHPREGSNLISAIKSGTLPRGFLESATVFSESKDGINKWALSNTTKESLITNATKESNGFVTRVSKDTKETLGGGR